MSTILRYTLEVVVPSTRHDKPVEDFEFYKEVQDAVAFLATLCGGATAVQGFGGWVYEDGKLGTEKVFIVTAYTDDLTGKVKALAMFAKELKKRLHQEAVLIRVNGKAILV